jgi:hypothetical protein
VRFAPLIEWRPNQYLLFSVRYDERIFYDLDACHGGAGVNCVKGGDVKNRQFNARLVRFRTQNPFTPDLIWNTIAQYENLNDRVEMQTRLRWIIVPGREMFVIVGQDLDAKPGDFRVRETNMVAKLRWTLRF